MARLFATVVRTYLYVTGWETKYLKAGINRGRRKL
jgi:hypothetical protein